MGRVIGFRVDANEYVASGHLMRCIAIAKACIKEGNKCIFFLAEEKMTERLAENNIQYHILNSKWNNMEEEYSDLIMILKREGIELLVVDSYQASKKYLEMLNNIFPVCYIDDMGKETYDIDMILHYGSWADEHEFESRYAKTQTKVLEGMKYAPLREEFAEYRAVAEREKSILITTGATDPYNISGKLVKELLKRESCLEHRLKVIIGAMNSNISALEELLSDNRVELLKNVNNMGELMRTSQYAVSAGGTTLLELCASGIPTVCFSFAENQEKFCEEMEEYQIMLCAGDARNIADIHVKIADKLELFVKDEQLVQNCVVKMRRLVDGQGAKRIAEAVVQLRGKSY